LRPCKGCQPFSGFGKFDRSCVRKHGCRVSSDDRGGQSTATHLGHGDSQSLRHLGGPGRLRPRERCHQCTSKHSLTSVRVAQSSPGIRWRSIPFASTCDVNSMTLTSVPATTECTGRTTCRPSIDGRRPRHSFLPARPALLAARRRNFFSNHCTNLWLTCHSF
jgi:hypothetical protein